MSVLLTTIQPDEVYHLAAPSHVRVLRRARIHLGNNRFGHNPIAGGNPADRVAMSFLSGLEFGDVGLLTAAPE